MEEATLVEFTFEKQTLGKREDVQSWPKSIIKGQLQLMLIKFENSISNSRIFWWLKKFPSQNFDFWKKKYLNFLSTFLQII
jgi:hypothetical protein